ncbi:hypothetical protein [Bacillus salipaludis]|uniref:hypothetical protein n=1 Tax=Bacillus salipaludis TaxID=2547811 RepID=UPI002E206FE7|nr:hypothetical protein [Bacillus salipaludis]
MEKREYLIKPVLGSKYITAQYGEGIDIFNLEGNKYIDGSSGAVTVSIGHGVQEIINCDDEPSTKDWRNWFMAGGGILNEKLSLVGFDSVYRYAGWINPF